MPYLYQHPVTTALCVCAIAYLVAGLAVWKRANPARPDGTINRYAGGAERGL